MLNKKIIKILILAAIIFFTSAALVFFLVRRENKAIGDRAGLKAFSELKSNYQGLSYAQIKFYEDTAKSGVPAPCLGRDDENICVSAASFIRGESHFCLELEHENEQLYKKCVDGYLKKKAETQIGQCEPLSDVYYYNCLWSVFSVYSEQSDCLSLAKAEIQAVCQDLFNYLEAVLNGYDRALCKNIKNDKLNQYCLRVTVDKKQRIGEAVKRGLIKAK